MRERPAKFDGMWLIIALALLFYVLPWVLNPGVTLSIGAYDFAEFLAKRNMDTVTYNTMLALRGQLFIMTALLAIRVHRPYFTAHWWSHVIVCFVLIMAQLPPLTFFANFNDANQQQQAVLAGISAIIAIIGLSGFIWQYRHILGLIFATMGIFSALYGLINALDIMNDYAIPSYVGVGGIGLIMLYIVIGLWHLYQQFFK